MGSPGWDAKEFEDHLEPEPKKLTSPAGLRLSTILESSSSSTTKVGSTTTKGSRRPSFSKKFKLPGEDRDSAETYRNGYTYNIFSEKAEGPPQLPTRQGRDGFFARRGGWRRILLIALLFLFVVVAIAVGLAVGLRRQSSSGASDAANSSAANAGATDQNTSTGAMTGTPVSSGGSSTSNDNATFPLGSYSIATFLDTVQTNCTTNPNTWTCFPYTIYNTSPTKALTTFNWIITADPKNTGKYLISSTENPFAITFANTSLTLEGQGTAQERYTFRAAMSKKVVPSSGITADNSATTCFFNSTNFQGYLYTKQAKTYDPVALGVSSSQAGLTYPVWPYAARAEQISSGGPGTPDCYKTVNGILGDKVEVEVTDNGAGYLCSCLYRNWMTTNTQAY